MRTGDVCFAVFNISPRQPILILPRSGCSASNTSCPASANSLAKTASSSLKSKFGSQAPLDEAIWQFENDAQGWTPYPAAVSAQLMDAYTSGISSLRVTCEGRSYEVDFQLQMQMNMGTMKRRRIRCNLGLPKHWQMSNEDGLKLIRGEASDERGSEVSYGATVLTAISVGTRRAMQIPFTRYVLKIVDIGVLSELESLLNNSLKRHDGTVCQCIHGQSVYRLLEAYQVRNPYLWRRFQRFGKTIQDKQKQFRIVPEGIQPSVGDALTSLARLLEVDLDRNERLLFHGTRHFGYAKAIATEGFDNRVAQRGLYGNGTYFAAQTCKSAQYAAKGAMSEKIPPGRAGTILVARVAVGDPFYATGGYEGSRALAARIVQNQQEHETDGERETDRHGSLLPVLSHSKPAEE